MRIPIPEIPTGYQPESSTVPVRTVAEHWRTILAVVGLSGLSILTLWGMDTWREYQRNIHVSRWADEMRARLADPSKLLRVTVVPAGRTWTERWAMQDAGTLVNVRDYPDDSTGRVIGQIFQDSTIDKVLFTTGTQPGSPLLGKWGTFRCADAPIIWERGINPGSELAEICAVYGIYLSPQYLSGQQIQPQNDRTYTPNLTK